MESSNIKILPNAIKFVQDYYVSMCEIFGFEEKNIIEYSNRILAACLSINDKTIFRTPRIQKYVDKGYLEYYYIPKPKSKGRTHWYFECKKDEQGNIVIHEIIPSAMMHDAFVEEFASYLIAG